MQQPVFVLSV